MLSKSSKSRRFKSSWAKWIGLMVALLGGTVLVKRHEFFSEEKKTFSHLKVNPSATIQPDQNALNNANNTVANKVPLTGALKDSTPKSEDTATKILSQDLKKIVLAFPSINSLDSHRKQKEYFEALAQNKTQTRELLQMFGNLKTMQRIFGVEQAKARVKLLNFFKYIKKEYSEDIRKSLIEIQKDPNFIHKKMGRDFDYRDLAQIYFSSLSEEDLKNHFVSELKEIQYQPAHNWLIAYAIAHAHPNLLKDSEFTTWAQNILTEEAL